MSKKYKSILTISDMHSPFYHPDTVDFLSAIKEEYSPEVIVCIGDETDKHSFSFHDHDPDLYSPGHELKAAIKNLRPIYKLFPDMHIIDSNHGSLVYRRAINSGLPRTVIRSYREILDAPKGWNWHNDLVLTMSDNRQVYFHHGKSSVIMKLSKNMSMCAVQGHFHSNFSINYWANPNGLYWQMSVGCLINDKDLAFNYNKTTMDRPIIGTGIIINGQPLLIPMILKKGGRWIGKII